MPAKGKKTNSAGRPAIEGGMERADLERQRPCRPTTPQRSIGVGMKKKIAGSRKSKRPDEVHTRTELEIQNEELRSPQGELEESRNRYVDLYDLAPVGYFTLGRNGLVLETNVTGADLLGTERASLKGKLFARFVLDDDQNIFFSHMGTLVENEAPQTCELRLVNRDNTTIYARMESAPVRDGTDDVVCIRSAVVDVTQQKEVELALRKSEERFRLITETSPDIIFQIDPKGTIVYCSPSIQRILGYAPAKTEGGLFQKYVLPSERPAVRHNFRQLILGEEIRAFDLRILSKSGTPVPLEINASPLLRAGKVEFILGIARDITGRKAMEDDLREARDELEVRIRQRTAELQEANEALRAEVVKRKRFEDALRGSTQKILLESERRRFLSGKLVDTIEGDRRDVAMYLHDEIGQMLATLKMDIEMLGDDAFKTKVQPKEKLGQIREKILTVMGNVRDISKKLRPDMLDTLGLIPSLRSLIRTFKEEDNLSIDFFHGEIPEGFDSGKALAVYRIIQEALNNVTRHAAATEVFVNLVVKNDSILLSVEDNGQGFDYEKMMETAATGGSTGIMIMRERAVHVGGELSVDSKIGKGTRVMLEMPIR